MSADARLWLRTIVKGVGQIAFCDRIGQGGLVLAAIATLSLPAAGLALGGAILGTLAGRILKSRPESEWREGLCGVNPAIAGLFAAWLFRADAEGLASALALVAAAIAIDALMRPVFRRILLPEFSAPALLAVFVAWAARAAFGHPFWPTAPLPPLDPWVLVSSAVLLAAALWLRSPRGAATTIVLAGFTMVVSGQVYGIGPFELVGPYGLWVFTVAPVAFGAHGVLMAGAWRGAVVAVGASAFGAGLWLAWVHGPPITVLPPLTIPMLLALWLAAIAVRILWGKAIQRPELWYVAERIRRARSEGRGVVALTGAGVSTASGIPDYVSGAWFDPAVPTGTYSFSRYLASARCRRTYWDSCRRFLDVVLAAKPNAGHAAMTELARRGTVTAIVTQNVDNLHQASGAGDVIELHGTIHEIGCLDCGARHEWPPGRLWHRYDLRCSTCGGFLKPRVTALGEPIPPVAWRAARRAVKNCGVLLVIGSQLAISSAVALVAEARSEGALVVFINVGPAFDASFKADVVIAERAETLLPALAVLLDASWPAPPHTVPSPTGGALPQPNVQHASA